MSARSLTFLAYGRQAKTNSFLVRLPCTALNQQVTQQGEPCVSTQGSVCVQWEARCPSRLPKPRSRLLVASTRSDVSPVARKRLSSCGSDGVRENHPGGQNSASWAEVISVFMLDEAMPILRAPGPSSLSDIRIVNMCFDNKEMIISKQ